MVDASSPSEPPFCDIMILYILYYIIYIIYYYIGFTGMGGPNEDILIHDDIPRLLFYLVFISTEGHLWRRSHSRLFKISFWIANNIVLESHGHSRACKSFIISKSPLWAAI